MGGGGGTRVYRPGIIAQILSSSSIHFTDHFTDDGYSMIHTIVFVLNFIIALIGYTQTQCS